MNKMIIKAAIPTPIIVIDIRSIKITPKDLGRSSFKFPFLKVMNRNLGDFGRPVKWGGSKDPDGSMSYAQ